MTDTPTKRLVKRVAAPTTDNGDDAPTHVSKRVVKKMAAAPAAAPTKSVAKKMAAAPTKAVAKKAAAPVAAPRPEPDEDAELRGGWSAAQETMDSTSTWAATFRPATSVQIIKILQASPYASYRRHWVNRVGIGQRAYTCLESVGRSCPLCDVGDKPSAVSAFNIALCGDDGEAVVKSWDAGVRITQSLKTFSNDPKIGPLDKRTLYFAVSKTESSQRQQTQTLVVPARERDLKEDYGVPPLDDDQLERLMTKMYDPDIVQLPKASELEEIAAEMLNEDTGAGQGSGWGGN